MLGHTASTAGTFRRISGIIPERPQKCSQSVPWNSPQEYGWVPPNPIIQGILGFPEHFQNSLPMSMAGEASFFRSGSGEGLFRAVVMEFPAVLKAFQGICRPTDAATGLAGRNMDKPQLVVREALAYVCKNTLEPRGVVERPVHPDVLWPCRSFKGQHD